MKDFLIRKLTSRKFWTMIAGMISCFMVYRGSDEASIQSIVSVIGMIGNSIIYMLVEGKVDRLRE